MISSYFNDDGEDDDDDDVENMVNIMLSSVVWELKTYKICNRYAFPGDQTAR